MILIFLIVFLQLADLQDAQQLQHPQYPQYLPDPQYVQDPQDPQYTQDSQEQCPGGPCNPQLGDLMLGRAAQLSASSTCGLNGPQDYCIIGYLQEDQKCFTCDSQLPYNRYSQPNSHRIENVIATFDPERRMKWWQSENGVHQVSIQLDLETVFQFSHLVLTFKSFRPTAMLVERSRDFGRTWKVYRYFAEDCALHFPSVSSEPADSVDDVVCDSRYSGPEPSTEGEVVLKALDPVFQIENPYAQNIQDLITLTNIRVNFTRLFTLGDTLLSRRRRNPQNKYFYSLYDMVVRGSCFCHGHASRCSPVDGGRGDAFSQPGMIHGRCVCQHNTAGENCERCMDFHHDAPWRPGGEHPQNVCRRCNCHGHSESCHFDAARYEATGGSSGGVCDGCRNQRTGPQCERCQDSLYQDPQRSVDDPHACIPCDCDRAGSVSGVCDGLTGRCICKQNVEGERCDRCRAGFFGLREDDPTGCQACPCHALGSVGSCDQRTGACECDRLATGPHCDRCVSGFWGLGDSGFRCSPCDCDIGGARGTLCSPDGQCDCLPNMIGRRCSEPAPGYFLPSLDYFLYEAELAAPLPGRSPTPLTPPPSSSLVNPGLLPQCEQYFREQGYDFKVSGGRVVLVRRTGGSTRRRRQDHYQQSGIPLEPGGALQLIPRQRSPDQATTWTGLGMVRVLDGAGLRFTVDNLPSSQEYRMVIRYEPETPSDWLASISISTALPGNGGCGNQPAGDQTVTLPGNSRGAVLEAPLCLESGGQYLVDIVFNKQPGSDGSHILIDSMGLIPHAQSLQDFCSQSDVDAFRRFRCVGLTAEPEVCEGLVKSLSAQLHNGAVICRCNVIGSLGPACSKVGGVCECKTNVIGRCCDRCSPLTFGFGADGCKRCECDARGAASPLCDELSGQCVCRPEVTGQLCDRCQRGLWDFPRCQPCECNGRSEECDEDTGECVGCREHTTGPQCDRCVEGYYGDPLSGQPCQACLCPDIQSSERFFASSCQYDPQSQVLSCVCREGHTGPRCDRCATGFHGDLSVPGTRCEECPCNNNIDPDDRSACDGTTGECLHCLFNTTGPRCQHCKSGYYGNAARQDCKECSCDRRGTQVTQCPLGSPCFCDPETGQCPCRTGVVGHLCDECEDGFWNLDGTSGCQPCSCDPANSFSNICNKVTGQCPCRPEFGGQQCDECGENHFGNPDLQCLSCDCNLEGTERPSCDAETGECVCRRGVTGIFCDECAPGFDSTFPECAECHPCTALWTESVTDIQHAAQRMRASVPHRSDNLQPAEQQQWQRMQEVQWKLENLANMTGESAPIVEQLEELHLKIRKTKDAIDPNMIRIDPSRLLNTEIDNIDLEVKKLLNRMKNKVSDFSSHKDTDQQEELQQEIQKLHRSFMSDEKRVKNANKAVEDSMDTRQDIKTKLSTGTSIGDLAPLDKKIAELSVVHFNRKICGEPGLEDCSGCGGALCGTGKRKCGGPNCDGIVPVSQRDLENAERAADQLRKLPSRLQESRDKILEAKQAAQDTKDQAKVLQDQINSNADNFWREKNRTKDLIRRVQQYLTDDLVPPEDIDRISRAVLSIQLPRSPDQVQAMIRHIESLLHTPTSPQPDPKNLKEGAEEAKELLEKAKEVREQAERININQILQQVYEAEKAQDDANNNLEAASRDQQQARDRLQESENKLTDVESKLKNVRNDLLKDVKDLKNKSDENKQAARDARGAAEAAEANAADTQTELDMVMKQFENLKQKRQKDEGEHEAAERVKTILKEAKDAKREMDDKLIQIGDLENRILDLVTRKKQKAAEVLDLLKTVDSLRQEISSRAEGYSICTS